jgi:hypothetical protein
MLSETNNTEKPKFILEFIPPYSTFKDGVQIPIPYVIEGLLTQGGFSILGAKSKQGKSSLARYEAVCVAKGIPFLGRETVKGEVILISLEDPRNHIDNCLKVLGYDPKTDAEIRIIEKLPHTAKESIDVLGEALAKSPDVRLVIVDTLAKLLRVKDLNEYMLVLNEVERLGGLARQFSQLHIQGVAHSKKAQTDDPFDAFLGSSALRAEADTNIVIFQQAGQKVLTTETRIGKSIPPTILDATLVESEGADVVKDFRLDGLFDEWKKEKTEKREQKQKVSYESRIIEYLKACDNTAPQEQVLAKVQGKRESLLDAIKRLKDESVLSVTGVQRSPTNPLTLTLNPRQLSMYYMSRGNFQKAAEARTSAGLSVIGFADDCATGESINAEANA